MLSPTDIAGFRRFAFDLLILKSVHFCLSALEIINFLDDKVKFYDVVTFWYLPIMAYYVILVMGRPYNRIYWFQKVLFMHELYDCPKGCIIGKFHFNLLTAHAPSFFNNCYFKLFWNWVIICWPWQFFHYFYKF